MDARTGFNIGEARLLSSILAIRFDDVRFDLEEFHRGLNEELVHGRRHPDTNITNDDPLTTARMALAHLREIPDYYTRLSFMKTEAHHPELAALTA